MRLSRKGFFGVGLVSALVAGMAIAGNEQVIDFAAPPSVTAGYNFSASVTVNQPMSVTFTSSPAGLVNYTTTVSSPTQTVSVPTNGAMPEGSYTLRATPTAGGTSKTKIAVAVSSGL